MVIIVIGATGAGKTTIGRALAGAIGSRFVDEEDGQPGHELARNDLSRLHAIVARAIDRREHIVIACSALKHSHRQVLRGRLKQVRFVYLKADVTLLRRRVAAHRGGPVAVARELAALEESDDAITVDAAADPEEILARIRRELGV